MPQLEWSTAVVVLTAIFSCGGFYLTMKNDMKAVKEELKMLRETVNQIAVQNTRLDNQDKLIAASQAQQALLERRLYNLSQGKGWIKDKLDGEYP